MANGTHKSSTPEVDEPCWNCGGVNFTNSSSSHHLKIQLICAGCYEPQDEDDTYMESEDWW